MIDTHTEAAVFTMLMTLPDRRKEIFMKLRPEDFTEAGGKTYEWLSECYKAGTIDTGPVRTRMAPFMGGETDSRQWWKLCEDLIELAARNRLAIAAEELSKQAQDMGVPMPELAQAALETQQSLTDARLKGAQVSVADRTLEVAKDMRNPTKNDFLLGLPSLDSILNLDREEAYMILGARPSQGKSALMCTISNWLSLHGKLPGLFSFEMGDKTVLRRHFAIEASIPFTDIKQGLQGATQSEIQAFTGALDRYHEGNALLLYGDGQSKTVFQIYQTAVDWVRNKGCDCIIIDYIQKIKHENRRGRASRQEQIQHTSEALKEMQRELKVPVIALAQLNRGMADNKGKPRPPRVSDLRECGDLEQDADVIVLLDRPNSSNPPMPHNYTKPCFGGDPLPIDMSGKAALIVGKNRNGPTDFTVVHYEGPTMRFHEDRPV